MFCPLFNCLDFMNTMALLTMLLESIDADTSANSVKWVKSHVASHFDHLELTNAMVLLMIPSVSCDAHTSANSIMWPKSHVTPRFICLHLMNKLMPLMMQWSLHDSNADTKGIIWLKTSCFTLFWWSLWCNEYNGAIDNTNCIPKICLDII